MNTRSKRFSFFETVSQSLQTLTLPDHDAFIFLSMVSDGKTADISAAGGGNVDDTIQLLLATIASNAAADQMKKALFIATANLLAEQKDFHANMISKALGKWTELKYGKVICECPRCKARKERGDR